MAPDPTPSCIESHRHARLRSDGGGWRAFTLIEVLVCILIVSIILGILLPSIGAARARTMDLKCSNTLREISRFQAVWSGDNGGVWPNLFEGDEPGVSVGTNINAWGVEYFYQVQAWLGPLIGYIWNDGDGARMVTCPVMYRESPRPIETPEYPTMADAIPLAGARSSYFYSAALISKASMWSEAAAASGEPLDSYRRRVPMHDVTWPSAKVAMAEVESFHTRERAEVFSDRCTRVNAAFADGHVARADPTRATPAVRYAELSENFLTDRAIPFSSAPGGSSGRDFNVQE